MKWEFWQGLDIRRMQITRGRRRDGIVGHVSGKVGGEGGGESL